MHIILMYNAPRGITYYALAAFPLTMHVCFPGRDMLWSNFTSLLANGDGVCLGFSTEHSDHPPETGLLGYVRGKLHTTGYYCEHIQADANRVGVIPIIQTMNHYLPIVATRQHSFRPQQPAQNS